MGTGAEVVVASEAVGTTAAAKGAAEVAVATGAFDVGGSVGAGLLAGEGAAAVGAGGALAGGMSFAQPTGAIAAGLLPEASFAQAALAGPGGAFGTGALGGAAAGALGAASGLADPSNAALFPGESATVGAPASGWQQATSLAKDIYGNPIGKALVNNIGSSLVQGAMGGGTDKTDFRSQLAGMMNGYGAATAAPLRPVGLLGSSGVASDPSGTTASMERAAPVAPAGSAIGTQAAPRMPSGGGNGAVKLGNNRRQQFA